MKDWLKQVPSLNIVKTKTFFTMISFHTYKRNIQGFINKATYGFVYIYITTMFTYLFVLLLYVHSFSSWPTGMLVFTFSHIRFRQITQTFTCN